MSSSETPLLPACHELLELYPDSLRIREQVEDLQEATASIARVEELLHTRSKIQETACASLSGGKEFTTPDFAAVGSDGSYSSAP